MTFLSVVGQSPKGKSGDIMSRSFGARYNGKLARYLEAWPSLFTGTVASEGQSDMLPRFRFASRAARCRRCRAVGSYRLLAEFALLIVTSGITTPHAIADQTHGSSPHTKKDESAAFAHLLSRYCFECHGADLQEANVRLDTLDLMARRLGGGKTLERILRAVSRGKMPPEDAAMPTAQQRAFLVSWLEERLGRLAEEARRAGRWTRNRRLTVEEYNFTMRELFGIDAEFGDLLPADPISETGYRNESERLGLSSLQIESYLDSARRAVRRYVPFEKTDQQPLRYQIEFEGLFYSAADRYRTRKNAPQPLDADTFAARRAANAASPPKYVEPLSPMLPGAFSEDEAMRAAIPKLHQQYVAIPQRLSIGELIVRIRAAGTADRDGRFPRMRVEAGITLGDGCSIDKRVLGEVDVTASRDTPATYEFRIRLEDVPTKGPLRDEETFDRLSVFDMDQLFISNVSRDRRAIFALGRGGYADPATGSDQIAGQLKQMAADGVNLLHLDCIEIEMLPEVDANRRPYRWRVPVNERENGRTDELQVASELLGEFMRRAYRRPIVADEVATKLELFSTLRGRDNSFEESLRETLAAVLVSPSFLFLEFRAPASGGRPQEALAPHQQASRLSYLLWLAPPDAQLTRRADDGSLRQPSVLRSEAKRLLADPRSRRFLESFCRQWLRLDKHANVAVDRPTYPDYDDDLAAISIRETLAYFVEVFMSDSSALDLIDSNYAMLNDRLADHYSLAKVIGGALRKVDLPEDSVRGGLLTQASLMTMNSDGVDSHPIRRGVWLLDRFLNSPPPPPPPNVPDIDEDDPDFQGLSLKERIERHRRPGACQSCHKKIDPWGIPFENFDATGRWRDMVDDREGGNARRRPVDSSTTLPDGQRIGGVAAMKGYLRQQRSEQFANALVHHMLTYAIGRSPDYADRRLVHEVQARFAASQYRLRELVLAIVDSQLFQSAQGYDRQ